MADIERFARWIERFYVDTVVTSPTLMVREMVSRVQQYNGYKLALPSPIQLVEQYLHINPSTITGETLFISINPTIVSIKSTFVLTLAVQNPGAGPFVLYDAQDNSALSLTNATIGSTTYAASNFTPGTSTPIFCVDQATGAASTPVSVTWTN